MSDNYNPQKPTNEQIALLAYLLWEQGGRQSGTAESDWLRAQATLDIEYDVLDQQNQSTTLARSTAADTDSPDLT